MRALKCCRSSSSVDCGRRGARPRGAEGCRCHDGACVVAKAPRHGGLHRLDGWPVVSAATVRVSQSGCARHGGFGEVQDHGAAPVARDRHARDGGDAPVRNSASASFRDSGPKAGSRPRRSWLCCWLPPATAQWPGSSTRSRPIGDRRVSAGFADSTRFRRCCSSALWSWSSCSRSGERCGRADPALEVEASMSRGFRFDRGGRIG